MWGLFPCVHGTRNTSREVGASGLATFSEVHAYAFPAAIMLQFTSMICQGITVRFPKLKLAYLEIGATWLPYYLDRLDEHWSKRGSYEMPLLKGFGKQVTTEQLVLARNNLEISKYDLETQVDTTIERVEGAYWDVLAAREQVRISKLALKRANDLLRQQTRQTRSTWTLYGIVKHRKAA